MTIKANHKQLKSVISPRSITKPRLNNPRFKFNNLVPFLVVLFSSLGCDDVKPHVEKITDDVKSWGNFKVGSFWIYREKNTGIEDSVYVYNYDSTMLFHHETDGFNFNFELITSQYTDDLLTDSFSLELNAISSGVKLINLLDDKLLTESQAASYLVKPPPIFGETLSTGGEDRFVVFDSVFDSYRIGDLVFEDVVRANDKYNYAYRGKQTYFYTARNIGIIKKEFPETNQTWELVRYNVVR